MNFIYKDIIFDFSAYNIIWYFLIYALLGWIVEVIYATFKTKQFINRGFLNGCWCPLYGAGAVLIIVLLEPIGKHPFLVFVASMAITTLIEFLTGWILELLYHKKWWDYSERRFNIKGYVCLQFSVIWGILCLFVYDVIHPGISYIIRKIPHNIGIWFLLAFLLLFIFDVIISTIQATKFAKYVKRIRETYRKTSDVIGEKISLTTSAVLEQASKIKLKASQSRILKAFPNMKDKKDKNIIELIKERYKKSAKESDENENKLN